MRVIVVIKLKTLNVGLTNFKPYSLSQKYLQEFANSRINVSRAFEMLRQLSWREHDVSHEVAIMSSFLV